MDNYLPHRQGHQNNPHHNHNHLGWCHTISLFHNIPESSHMDVQCHYKLYLKQGTSFNSNSNRQFIISLKQFSITVKRNYLDQDFHSSLHLLEKVMDNYLYHRQGHHYIHCQNHNHLDWYNTFHILNNIQNQIQLHCRL